MSAGEELLLSVDTQAEPQDGPFSICGGVNERSLMT